MVSQPRRQWLKWVTVIQIMVDRSAEKKLELRSKFGIRCEYKAAELSSGDYGHC